MRYIYIIQSLINNKVYIGQTKNIKLVKRLLKKQKEKCLYQEPNMFIKKSK